MNNLDKFPTIPVIILTGFLGSGKTRFLSQMLALEKLVSTAVIINEFGEVALDHLLVSQVDDQVFNQIFELPGGCLCCNARGDLVNKMLEICDQRNKKTLHFDRLVIETSGISDASALARELWNDPQIRKSYRLARIITVVSAVEWESTCAANDEFSRQLALSDIVVISKADLLDEFTKDQKLGQLLSGVKSINNSAEIIVLPISKVQAGKLIADSRSETTNIIPQVSGLHNTSIYKTLTLSCSNRVSQNIIERFMDLLLSRHTSDILRLKGLVLTMEHPDTPMVVQAVGVINSPVIWLDNWREFPNTRLTVIHTGNIGARITALFNTMMDIPMLDQPDSIALTDNPLSITGLGRYDP